MRSWLAVPAVAMVLAGCGQGASPESGSGGANADVAPGSGGRAARVADRPASPPGFEGTAAGQERDGPHGIALVWCPAGTFKMGSPLSEDGHLEHEAQVQVRLTSGFWIGKYEITQAEYQAVTGKNPSNFTSTSEWPSIAKKVKGLDTSRFPVEMVKWDEARIFCELLTEREREADRLPKGWEYLLPTEAQWEYACRAGTRTPASFGYDFSSRDANFEGTISYGNAPNKGPYLDRTTTVGSYKPNPWGIFDMHGNVGEWCRDGYVEKLPGGDDPYTPATEKHSNVTRGGGYSGGTVEARSAERHTVRAGGPPGSNIGFRIVLARP